LKVLKYNHNDLANNSVRRYLITRKKKSSINARKNHQFF